MTHRENHDDAGSGVVLVCPRCQRKQVVQDTRTDSCIDCGRRFNPVAVSAVHFDLAQVGTEVGDVAYRLMALGMMIDGNARFALQKMAQQVTFLELELMRFSQRKVEGDGDR